MTDKLIPISQSEYSDTFKNVDVFELISNYANEVWADYVSTEGSHYFNIEPYHWTGFGGAAKKLGKWIEDYNEDNSENVNQLLNESIDWDDSDEIFFCVSSSIVLSCSWKVFKENWIDFMVIHNDCPIIVNSKYKEQGFVFYPLGHFSFIRKA